METGPVAAEDLQAPLRLLEAELRDGDPLPGEFVAALALAVRSGEAEMIAAWEPGSEEMAGAALVYYRLNLSSGGRFASFEELHVAPQSRGRGIGRALLSEVQRRCSRRGISYIEAQVIEESVDFFLSAGYEREEGVSLLSTSIPLG